MEKGFSFASSLNVKGLNTGTITKEEIIFFKFLNLFNLLRFRKFNLP